MIRFYPTSIHQRVSFRHMHTHHSHSSRTFEFVIDIVLFYFEIFFLSFAVVDVVAAKVYHGISCMICHRQTRPIHWTQFTDPQENWIANCVKRERARAKGRSKKNADREKIPINSGRAMNEVKMNNKKYVHNNLESAATTATPSNHHQHLREWVTSRARGACIKSRAR